MNTATSPAPTPEALRAAMVDQITAARHLAPAVEQAMRHVPRHAFVPGAPLSQAYGEQAVITKRAATGEPLSCASLPALVATMLDQLDVRPGMRVLEIGAGTGYNAALLAHIAGPTGEVTTVDIDPEVTAGARHALDLTGYGRVRVATRDGVLGDPGHAPYDRLIVTVGAWDLPPAWWEQLSPGGRAVVPLRWRGQTRSIAFDAQPGSWEADTIELCGFVPMIGQEGEHAASIDAHDRVLLHWDIDQRIDPAALTGVLDQPRTEVASGVRVAGEESFDGVWLRMTATEPGTCRIEALPAAVDSGLARPAIPSRSPALAEGASLAYMTLTRHDHDWELGAAGHGPAGPDLADRLCHQIREWGRARNARPQVRAHPAGAPLGEFPTGMVIPKQHSRLHLSI
ncbi:methyltransferase, FxLD system [Bailinhaonella thermotolerans]|uniref:Protein-L-isoaspartate O-methyltransferase n=1 Tax=Bailinhaonella thermotolerans TaxID=1070861 RepID=A0A3A4A5U2_9ACTN|nr:methyltransferase, FxLD system [Bailinhaonella thermotolerans]RJL23219.1 methyltransferase, FxLD system [Bailinhaonella thermotolerans]